MNSDFKAGTKIGKYVLESYLGGGSFGAVWRCRDEETGHTVAVKLLTGALSSSETAGMRAEVEMLAAFAAGRSEHVVNIIGGGPEPVPYVVMEYIEGSDFQTLLKDQRGLAQEQSIEAGIAISDALRALNEAGIIHRDIKPANVMVDTTGVIKLTDFGIAKIVGYETMTMTGQAAMTMAYAAPEIWDEGSAFGRPSHKSDLYAMGILLFQCLTGVTPFRGNYGALYKAHTERPPDIAALPADTAPSLRALISACLQKKQDLRPSDAEACLLMLRRAEVELKERAGNAPVSEPTRFGMWQRDAVHPTMPWAWRCTHQTSGDEATVEVHFAESLDYGAQLRKAVAANSRLAPLGAERIIETNRLLLRPDEAWLAAPAGQFQFWLAREDRDARPAATVTPALLAPAVAGMAALIDAAKGENVALALKSNLNVLESGEVYLRRPALETSTADPDMEALEFVHGLPLDAAASAAVAAAGDFRSLVESLAVASEDATIVGVRPDATVVLAPNAGDTVVVAKEQPPQAVPQTFCPNCGTPETPGQAFCGSCGRPSGARIAAASAGAAAGLGALSMDLRRVSAGPTAGAYELSLRNQASLPLQLALEARDATSVLSFSLPGRVVVPANSVERVPVRIGLNKRRMFGGKRTTVFNIAASSGGAGDGGPPLTTEGSFDDEPSKAPLFAGGFFGIAGVLVAVAVAFGFGGGGGDGPGASAQAAGTATPVPATATAVPTATPVPPTATPEPPTPTPEPAVEENRANCNQIRGTQYLSRTEEDWYNANCRTVAPTATRAPSGGGGQPQPTPAQNTGGGGGTGGSGGTQPYGGSTTVEAPLASVSCTSATGKTASVSESGTATSLKVNNNESITCTVSIRGDYQRIEWRGENPASGNSNSFTTRYTAQGNGVRNTTMYVDVYWAKAPVVRKQINLVICPAGTPNC